MQTKTLPPTVMTHREQLIKHIEQSGFLIVREMRGLFKNNEDFVLPHIILTIVLFPRIITHI